jgi:catechol 2,3-dioxygenase-like lactoylglutathione lyase family enzyme
MNVDMKLEVVVIPVADVDRATEFYRRLGWRQDVTPPGVVQFTPHGSWCSVQFGPIFHGATPTYLIVADLTATRADLVAAGVEVSEIFHLTPDGPADGLDPARGSYRSRATFTDPDGNSWLLQEVTTRLPGRVDATLTGPYGSVADLAGALRRAAAAHGEHEKRIGAADPDWPDWYAAYMVAEQAGTGLPQ